MSEIKTFSFDKYNFDQIRNHKFGKNWPVVYLIEDGKEIYVGETTSAYNRFSQHYENPERKKLKKVHLIFDDQYNKSATLDIESLLIQYIVADGRFVIQNRNDGLKNHDYYSETTRSTSSKVVSPSAALKIPSSSIVDIPSFLASASISS